VAAIKPHPLKQNNEFIWTGALVDMLFSRINSLLQGAAIV
jgi:hypothetical protein